MDRRRRRFIAWDAMFFDGRLGVMLRERFGPTGITVFNAFLCACKRNIVPGQIEFGSDADFLSQIGLPDLRLVDENGAEWTMGTFWRALGHHKQITRTSRGRRTQVRSTQWAQWQEDFTREVGAEKKRRSRVTNTETKGRRSTDETGTIPRHELPEIERETDIDPPPQGSSAATTPVVPKGPEEEELRNRVTTAVRLVAERRLAAREGPPINDTARWLRKVRAEVLADHGDEMRTLAGQGLHPKAIAERIMPSSASTSPAHERWEPSETDEPATDPDVARARLAEMGAGIGRRVG